MAMTQYEEPELAVRYRVPRWSPAWAIPEVPVPESDTHDIAIEYLRSLFLAWVARIGKNIKVARNLGIRWVPEEPRFGFDPDLCLIDPAPDDRPLKSLRLWKQGHAAPRVAIEVVSPGHPYKDYVDTPERAAACGIGELWIYDPMLAGPKAHGGPYLLQLWRKGEGGAFERMHAGSGPAYSQQVGAWLHPFASQGPEGAKLMLSDDSAGTQPWLTELEMERTAGEVERALRESSEQQIRELQTELEALRRGR
jgi:Uma2 family endonuclease